MAGVIETALKAVKEASEILTEYFKNLQELKIELKAQNDYVTEADKKAEDAIVKIIKSSFPHHAIVAEETGAYAGREWRWFVDPLDGTKNFIHGLPMFCISVGIEYKGKLVAGVVVAPALGLECIAESGSGAYCNGKRIRVGERDLESAMIATGFPFRGKALLDKYLKCFKDVFLAVSGVRRCGSAALDLVYTAKGIFDGFWEMSLHPWDIAGGAVILREAGGIVSDFDGGEGFLDSGNIIGASPRVYPELFKIIHKHLGGSP